MADDPNVTIMKQLYSKLAGALAVGGNQAIPGQNFLILANPGIFLDPKLDLSNADQAYLFASQLDVIPAASWMYGATAGLLSNLYNQILQFKELPSIQLTPSQQKQLATAQGLLMDSQGNPRTSTTNTSSTRRATARRSRPTTSVSSTRPTPASRSIPCSS